MNTQAASSRKPITLPELFAMRARNEKIAMLTCYDSSFARLLDDAGIDALLVGDSLGNVLQGHGNTLPVTLEQMIYHTRCVTRIQPLALVIADMPFGSYPTPQKAFENAAQLLQAGAHMVKLEGGKFLAETVHFLTERSIPVVAHIGLMPQSIAQLGTYKVQGQDAINASRIENEAQLLEQAGASLLLLEAIPATLAAKITATSTIPTIGIGAGPDCSGQVLVLHDMLGITSGQRPRFVKNFLENQINIQSAVYSYIQAVKQKSFPEKSHCY